MGADFMIVLRAVKQGAELRKVYTQTGEGWTAGAYTDAKTFTAARVAVSGLGDLHKHLHKLGGLPECCVIRGEPRRHLQLGERHERNYLDPAPTPDNPTPAPASYDACDHRWACIDVDKGDFPAELQGGEDLARCAGWIISKLPEWIQRAGWIVQWSNSAGTDGWKRIKAHVWIWMTRGACDESWRDYWRSWNKGGRYAAGGLEVDPVIYTPVQIHYTAPPRFDPPSADPCLRVVDGFSLAMGPHTATTDQRIIWSVGEAADPPAALVDLATWERLDAERDAVWRAARKLAAGRKQATSTVWGAAAKLTAYGARAMDRAVDAVNAHGGDPSYYLTLRREIYSTFGLVHEGAITEDQWRSRWEEERDRAGWPGLSLKDLKRLLDGAERKSKPRDLSHVGGSTDAAAQLQMGAPSEAPSGGFTRHKAP